MPETGEMSKIEVDLISVKEKRAGNVLLLVIIIIMCE